MTCLNAVYLPHYRYLFNYQVKYSVAYIGVNLIFSLSYYYIEEKFIKKDYISFVYYMD